MEVQLNQAIITAGIVLLGAVAAILWWWLRREPDPEERERQRRLFVHQRGRMVDAALTDVTGNLLHYTYSAGGMGYQASQDISAIRNRLPEDIMKALGPVTVKYVTQNPANSIVICEQWSGIRRR